MCDCLYKGVADHWGTGQLAQERRENCSLRFRYLSFPDDDSLDKFMSHLSPASSILFGNKTIFEPNREPQH